jgi:glycogen debranching enzyme
MIREKQDTLVKFNNNEYYFHAASSYADDEVRVLNAGDTFAVLDRWGDINPIGKGVQGLYHQGTRFISNMQLRLNQLRPVLLSSNVKYENESLSVDLTNPAMDDSSGQPVQQGMVHLLRAKFLQDGVFHENITLHNYGQETCHLQLQFVFEGDFKDIFEVRGMKRKQGGELYPGHVLNESEVQLTYKGLDNIKRKALLRFRPYPDSLQPQSALFNITLPAKQSFSIQYAISLQVGEEPLLPAESYTQAYNKMTRELQHSRHIIAHVHTSNEQFNHWLNRSKNDLLSLLAHTPKGLYPYAGVPWYNTIFGRDGIITALSTLWIAPDIAKGVLLFLADKQAIQENPLIDAEPGKILHEMRYGEMAATGEIPFREYYGSIDATPLFIILAGQYLQRTNDLMLIAGIWENIRAALHWIDRYGDIDGDGFVEYARKAASGLANQGWKDSHDAVSYANGELAASPIALCEVQGYVYEAKLQAAGIARRLGHEAMAQQLEAAAAQLQKRFSEQFWDEALGTYVLALDGYKRPCRVISSNAGHCLYSGIATPEQAARTAEVLMREDMFTSWGIRTLSAKEKRYNPMSYHNGSVWPHDTAIIAAGFARYDMTDKAMRLMQGLFDASLFIHLQRLPELFCGFHSRNGEAPTAYPVACSPQAWAVAAVYLLLQSCLRVSVDAAAKQLRFHKPQLPSYLHYLKIDNLPAGKDHFELEIFRYEHDLGIHVLHKPGGWDVVVTR